MFDQKDWGGLTSLFFSFFCFVMESKRQRYVSRKLKLNELTLVKALNHEVLLEKKVTKIKHRTLLKTNPSIKWQGAYVTLDFVRSSLLVVLFCYSSLSLSKLKTLSCNSSAGGPTKLCGFYFLEDWKLKKERLNFFLINFYGVCYKIDETLMFMVRNSENLQVADRLPHNWKRPPYRTRKPGAIPRLDFYYSGKSSLCYLIEEIVVGTPNLVKVLIESLFCKSNFNSSSNLEGKSIHKGYSVLKDWSWEQKEKLLYKIFLRIPFNYWSIYMHYIREPFRRKELYNKVSYKGDYYVCSKVRKWKKVPLNSLEKWNDWVWVKEEKALHFKIRCKYSGRFIVGQTNNLYKLLWAVCGGNNLFPSWIKDRFTSVGYLGGIKEEFEIFSRDWVWSYSTSVYWFDKKKQRFERSLLPNNSVVEWRAVNS
jgi:hypothetical protein